MRIGTASAINSTVDSLNNRQSNLGTLQQQLSVGKKVLRPSDDPTAIGQAERAQARLSRIQTDQRALQNQKASLQQAESTLGDASTLLQNARDLMLSANSSALSASDRASIAAQVLDVRDQLLQLANRKDSNGVALFGGLGTDSTPFAAGTGGVTFNGTPGQAQPTQTAVPGVLDGQQLWMNVPTGNGVFSTAAASGNTGSVWADAGQVTDPASVTGHNYQVSFTQAGSATTWSVQDTTAGTTVLSGQPYVNGQTIQFDGLSLVAKGTPKNGDAINVAPSQRSDIFSVLANAASAIRTGGAGLQGALSKSTTELDTGMDRLATGRSQAGAWLNRADSMESVQQDYALQQEQVRSSAEDVDMVRTISDLQSAQTGLDAALKSYAQIQGLSLFKYISG